MKQRTKRDIRRDPIVGVICFLALWEVSAQLLDNSLTVPPTSAIMAA